jgi:ABC-type multidrug transport system fused ATPase/permease subunit
MDQQDRFRWFVLTGLRAALALVDLAAVFAIGFVATSVTFFLTSGSDPDRIVSFAGLNLPALNAQTLPFVAFGVLALFLCKALVSIFLTKRAAFLIAKVEAKAARRMAEAVFFRDLGATRKLSREEITFAIQGGSPAAFPGLLNATNTLVTEGVLFIVVCLGFLLVDPLATLAAVLYFGGIAATIHFFVGSKMTKAGQISADSAVAANSAISNLLAVYRELFVLGKRGKFIDDIYEARIKAADSQATTFYLVGMPRYVIETALLIGIGLFVVGQGLSGDIFSSAGTLGVFLAGGFRLTGALLPLQSSLLTIKSIVPVARTAHDILDSSRGHLNPEEQIGANHTESDLVVDGPIGIELKGVSFYYENEDSPAIKNLTLSITPGSQVALIGPSGSGKSTIADLICGAITPSDGTILKSSSESFSMTSLRAGSTSYVPQRPGMVSGTILENVALGEDPEIVDRAKVLAVLKQAHLLTVVEALPDGIDTDLGKHRDSLSVGQIQRLGLARALYPNPGLLVVDETTSALDGDSEAQIQKALDELRGKVTLVVIAHRLNTIQFADQVFLINDGELKDKGKFKELVSRNPSLERMVDLMRVERD